MAPLRALYEFVAVPVVLKHPTPTHRRHHLPDRIPRSAARISTARTLPATQGDVWNYTNSPDEPAHHALGRSRGGLSTKIHQICDGNCRPLVVMIGPGQGGDSPVLRELLAALRVHRAGPGRPRTRPDALLGDKAYSSRANRTELRRRAITTVIPEPADQQRHRKRRGRRGGRPVSYDRHLYKRRNTVERAINLFKNWRGIATRYDKLAQTFRAGIMLATACIWLRTLGDTP